MFPLAELEECVEIVGSQLIHRLQRKEDAIDVGLVVVVPKLESSGDRVGHVIAIGADADEAEANAENALSRIRIITK